MFLRKKVRKVTAVLLLLTAQLTFSQGKFDPKVNFSFDFEDANRFQNKPNGSYYISDNEQHRYFYIENKSYDSIADKKTKHIIPTAPEAGLFLPEITDDGDNKVLFFRMENPTFDDDSLEYTQRVELDLQMDKTFPKVGDDFTFSFRIKIPESNALSNNEGVLVSQIWQASPFYALTNPALFLVYKAPAEGENAGKRILNFVARNDTGSLTGDTVTKSVDGVTFTYETRELGTPLDTNYEIVADKWYEITIETKFGQNGYVTFSVDSQIIGQAFGTIGYGYADKLQPKIGIYRNVYGDNKSRDNLEVYFDDISLSVSEGSTLPLWDSTLIYVVGDKVLYNGLEWEAKWWTHADIPGESGVWECITTSPIPAWGSKQVYSSGDLVNHNGMVWQAKWWTQGNEPSGTSAYWDVQ